MLQQPQPQDFVIATGEQYSVRDFINAAAQEFGFELAWKGFGVHETATVANTLRRDTGFQTGQTIVRVDPQYFRPTEVETLLGDGTKARTQLGWKPSTPFSTLVSEMVRHDRDLAARDALCEREGYVAYRYAE
jgi:GDPmannose 4,6-dehydratase